MEKSFNFKGILNDLEEYEYKIELSSSDNSLMSKIKFKLKNIISVTENVDFDLYASLIDQSYNSLNNYCSNFISGNRSYLSNINSCVGKILDDLMVYIDFNLIFGDKNGIKNNIKYYKSEITKSKNKLDDEYSNVIAELNNYKKNLSDKNSDVNSTFNDLENKILDLKNRFELLSDNINQLLNQSSDKVEVLISSSKSEFNELKKSFSISSEKKVNETLIKYENELSDYYNKCISKYTLLFEEVEKKNAEVSNLLNIVADKTRIGQYKKSADTLRKERYFWQVITIILFLGSFGLMFYITFCTKDYSKFMIIKYIMSLLLMGAATYTGKQASNCRKDETYYRKQELELASIDTYLVNMDNSDRDQIKKDLSLKIFGQAHKTYSNKYDEKTELTPDFLTKIIDFIKEKNN